MLDEIVKQPDCRRLVPVLQSPEKCKRECLQVLACVTCLELEKRFPDRRVNAVLVQHARDMRRPSRQFHLVTEQAPDFTRQPLMFGCFHIDTPGFAATAAASTGLFPLTRRRAP